MSLRFQEGFELAIVVEILLSVFTQKIGAKSAVAIAKLPKYQN